DAGTLLDALAWESSLVMGTTAEPGWYRVHPVLRAYLRADLKRRRPDLVATLHAHAADWFAAADLPDAAVEHARQTECAEAVAELLRRHGITLLLKGDRREVRLGLAAVGTDGVAADPLLTVLAAFTRVQEGDPAGAEATLAEVPAGDSPADVPAMTTLVA